MTSYYSINHKQSPRGSLKQRCSENMQQIYRRTPMPKCDFALQHGCSPVNLLHIFRTPFHRNNPWWLLLINPMSAIYDLPAQTAWTVFRLPRFNIWFENVKVFWIFNVTWLKFPYFWTKKGYCFWAIINRFHISCCKCLIFCEIIRHISFFKNVLWKKICSKFTGEHPYWSEISIKVALQLYWTHIRHGCSPVNLLHVLRTAFIKNTSGRLLLFIQFSRKHL